MLKMTVTRRLFILVVVAAAASCLPWRGGGEDVARNGDPRLEIRNGNFQDVVVYLRMDGGESERRLGSVGGIGEQVLALPRFLGTTADAFQLLVTPIGSRASYRTERISLKPGDTLVLTVGNPVETSRWHLR